MPATTATPAAARSASRRRTPSSTARLEVDAAAERVANFFHALTSEIQILARACGKSDVHHLEPEDLRALTLEASMITGLPLAGTNRVFGGGPGW